MEKSNQQLRTSITIGSNVIYLLLTIIIWNLAANYPFSIFSGTKSFFFLASEICWALGTLTLLKRWDVRLTLTFNLLPLGFIALGHFPLLIFTATLFYGVVNILLRVPRVGINHSYGLLCFSLTNAVIPVATLNFLTSQYLERSTLLNIGILFTLYVLFFALRFTKELATQFNVLFIFLFAGLLLANFPVVKDAGLIAIVLVSYGAQIFTRNERFRYCFITFALVALLAFFH
ncbi:hypothetical protein [Fructilactobacillus cliffordii]|uniref:Uncharacterized protein n=1 Tax=Fructilactobacillus cliffordii TaxID=2940299 RepID=A0A9Q9E293_9LACO|nr:hypothetical protein [Fructilactobacillus cliffordii]USS86525.1 hypothetical protein M3M38_00140 [Fructilactobacillus cliffordii]USS89525.1 hypothetical protein M3M40_01685 [Fructilactobacillus cliffordii]